MSEASITIGRILSYCEEEHLHNLNMIDNLASQEDGYATLTREMFCQNKLQGKMSWVLGFSRSYKNIESRWKNWIDEFENLLKTLKWRSAMVILETEMFGTHQYTWMTKTYPNGQKFENNYGLIEKEDWYFGKGFRNFWGMPQLNFGFDELGDEIRTVKSIIDSIDESIKGKSARFKIFENDDGTLKFLGSSDGTKKFVSEILKHYVNLSVQNTNWRSQAYEELESIVHMDSPKQVSEIAISSSYLNTKWIHEFIDKNIDGE